MNTLVKRIRKLKEQLKKDANANHHRLANVEKENERLQREIAAMRRTKVQLDAEIELYRQLYENDERCVRTT